jgi:hypothetical protein
MTTSRAAQQKIIDAEHEPVAPLAQARPAAIVREAEANPFFGLIRDTLQHLGGGGAKEAAESVRVLVELKREEDAITARRDFFASLAEFRSKCPPIPKDHTTGGASERGGKWQIRYAPLDTIERVIKPIAIPLGFSWRWDTKMVSERMMEVTCFLMHRGGHVESATMPVAVDSGGSMNATQKLGSTRTYGERYSLEQVFGLCTTDDTDALDHDPQTLEALEEDQIATLEHWISTTGSDRGKFLDFMRARSVPEIRQCDFDKALNALKRKASR